MAEQYANRARTTLSSALSASATSLSVASATKFPTAGNFRLLIEDEVLLVSAVVGTTFTVTRGQEGTSATAHASGATVSHVLTAAGLRALLEGPGPITLDNNVAFRARDSAGTAIELLKLQTDNTVRLGTLSAPASNGHLLLYANGAEKWRITPEGYLGSNVGRIGVGTLAPSALIHIHDVTEASTLRGFFLYKQLANGTGSATYSPLSISGVLRATDVAYSVYHWEGIKSFFDAGGVTLGTPVAATASAENATFLGQVSGIGDVLTEHAGIVNIIRYDIGSAYARSDVGGRTWMFDNMLHTSIGVQQQMITGVAMGMNNHYNGPPLQGPAACFLAYSYPGVGGFSDATHQAATSYPVDIGFQVAGKSGTTGSPTTAGFAVGFKAGGSTGPWSIATSRLQTAFYGRDVDTTGLLLDNAFAGSTPTGIKFGSGGQWGWFIDMSGAAAPAVGGINMVGSLQWATDNSADIGATNTTFRPRSIFAGSSIIVGANTLRLQLENSGGKVVLARATAQVTAPGASVGALYFRDGTNANTLKLVVRAGTAGAETVVLDNIPTV